MTKLHLLIAAALLASQSTYAFQKAPADQKTTHVEGEESPPLDPDLFKHNAQVWVGQAQFLYWAVSEGGLDYALKQQHAVWGPSESYAQGRYENATFAAAPGFKVGFEYFRAPHYWEVKWQYTHLIAGGKDTAVAPTAAGKYLVGTWPQIFDTPMSYAKSNLHFNYNIFDWLVSRVFFPNPHLRLRVLGGAFTGWMNQKWILNYVAENNDSTTIRNKWKYFGGGLKSGAMVDWYWTWDLYMTAQATMGALIGTYSNHVKQTTNFEPDAGDNSEVPVRQTNYSDVRPTFTAQVLLGPSWQKNFPNNRAEVFAGFEANVWWNLQEVYRSTGSTSAFAARQTWMTSGLLTMYGLTTRVTVDF